MNLAMNLRRALVVVISLGLPAFTLAANDTWMSDLDAAKTKAAKEHRPLLLEFTGSKWCGPCIALHADVLTKPEFAAFSRDFVLVALDYPTLAERAPEKVRANPELARLMAIKEKYEAPGFPTVILFDAGGKQVAKIVGYRGEGPKTYLAKLSPPAK